jgi:hypothetical protein
MTCRCAINSRCGRCDESRRDLAVEIAERNDRCGHVEQEQICLLGKKHDTPHKYEPITTTIPIE